MKIVSFLRSILTSAFINLSNKRIIILVGCLLFILFQSFVSITSNMAETQKYTVVHKTANFEIRHYPAAILATYYSNAKTYKELANPGFRKIASYIFGSNEGNKKIAMTTPVHMDMNSSKSSMSFVMPSKYDLDKLPKPLNSELEIHEVQSEFVAVITFSGYANDESIQKKSTELSTYLTDAKIKTMGPYRYLGYNAPYQFIGRKNEIIVKVEWNL